MLSQNNANSNGSNNNNKTEREREVIVLMDQMRVSTSKFEENFRR